MGIHNPAIYPECNGLIEKNTATHIAILFVYDLTLLVQLIGTPKSYFSASQNAAVIPNTINNIGGFSFFVCTYLFDSNDLVFVNKWEEM